MDRYRAQLSARRDPVAGTLNRVFERVRGSNGTGMMYSRPKRGRVPW
jgi:hypothetical protein